MQQTHPMKGSTPRLSDAARHVVVPEGIVSTGWPAVRNTLAELGIGFDPWQVGAAQLILSKDAEGYYATTVGGLTMSIPRQVGKTFMIGWIVFALCIIFPGLTVTWSAHKKDTADETFDGMKSMAASPKMIAHIDRTPDNGSEQKIEFTNGSRVIFGARERGFGRGFTKVDIVVFDEAQILTERAVDDMIPAQSVAPNALTVMIGTPPKPIDPSEIFEEARRAALSGDSTDALYIEFSADEHADLDDRKQWRKANPSYPHRTKEKAMLRLRRKLTPESFKREALGVWDKEGSRRTALNHDAWDARKIDSPDAAWQVACFAVDMSVDRQRISIGVVTFSGEATLHLELAVETPFAEEGIPAVVEWLWERASRRVPIVIDGLSPARDLLEVPLKTKKMKVFILGPQEYLQACAMLTNAVEKQKSVTHFGQSTLDDAIKVMVQEPVKGKPGIVKWTYADVEDDISPGRCISSAHYGALKFGRRRAADSGSKKHGFAAR